MSILPCERPIVLVGFRRSVNHSQNGFFRDCLVDEMAHAAGRTPINTDAGC